MMRDSRNLVDVVSKNGVVLLNISPKSDGSIPEEQQQVLRTMGQWLKTYGEAIYETRARSEYGYGTANITEDHFGGQSATVQYSAGDIRFTESKDQKTIYAIFLWAPEPGKKVVLRSLRSIAYPPKYPVKRVSVLGIDQDLEFAFNDHDNYVVLPDAPMNEIATVVKIEME